MAIELPTGTPEATGAARFRNRDGRYIDPLPGCDIADATDESWERVTTILGRAFSSDWSAVACKRIAVDLADRPRKYDNLEPSDAAREMRAVDKAGLHAAAERGSGVHAILEAELGGPAPMFVSPSAEPYRAACLALLDEIQPTPVMLEFVCINRDMNEAGYGGTCDAIWAIDGDNWIVDYKSRGDGHTRYAKEAAQLGAYASAEYIIRADGDRRERLPDLAGGLVVSINTDGARIYPVEL